MSTTFPQVKHDPLRPFPHGLPEKREHIRVATGQTGEQTLSPTPGRTHLDVVVADGASLTLLLAATYDEAAFRELTIDATVGRDATLHVIDRVFGGSRIETRAVLALTAPGANGKFTGMYHGRGAEHHGCHVVVQHLVPSTRGDVLVRGVYEGESRSVFTGLIRVAPGAQQTRSYYRDDVLLLDTALAESLPTLEIEANDVKASHGSTTSRVNDEQLFYLMSRGIPADQARHLIVAGFLTPALKRVPEALCQPFLPTD